MSNSVTASIIFSFKGQTHEPKLELELDDFMKKSGCLPDICMLLARANNFDMYSYEYEMMQTEPIKFDQASGLVSKYVNDCTLDVQGFEAAWKESVVIKQLSVIAKNELSIDDLDKRPDIKQALIEAYKLGNSN